MQAQGIQIFTPRKNIPRTSTYAVLIRHFLLRAVHYNLFVIQSINRWVTQRRFPSFSEKKDKCTFLWAVNKIHHGERKIKVLSTYFSDGSRTYLKVTKFPLTSYLTYFCVLLKKDKERYDEDCQYRRIKIRRYL